MNTRYDSLLTEWLLKFGMLKDKLIKNENIEPGVNCDCKQIIINNYLISIRNLFIPVVGAIQLLKYFDSEKDYEKFNCLFRKIEEFHYDECFKFLYHRENISHKLLFVFETLHNILFKSAIKEIRSILDDFIGYEHDEDYIIVNWIGDILYDLLEVGILTLSGLRINAFNLSNDIFNHKDFKYNVKDLKYFDISKITNCRFNCKDYCNELDHPECNQEFFKEELHLFLVPEYYKNSEFLDKYVDLILTYHCFTKNINMIADYQLIGGLYWTDKEYERFDILKDSVKSLKIVNYKKVDFNKYYKEVKDYLST